MKTTFYLIRHSLKFDNEKIIKYNSMQSALIKNEKIVLSVDGENRARRISELEELDNIDKVYVSNCVRTLATAKYLLEKQDLPVIIDERFDERRVGIPNSDEYPNWFKLQYLDENFKTLLGESQREVRARFNEAFSEILENNKGGRIAIFSHGYAITFFLMKWIKLTNLTDDNKFTFEFNKKIIFDKGIDAPEIFKLVIDENGNPVEINNIIVSYNGG